MTSSRKGRLSRQVKLASKILGITLAFAFATRAVRAQAPVPVPKPCSDCAPARPVPGTVQTFYLNNVTQQNDANEVLTALRNILPPATKITLVANQNAIVVEAPADQLAIAQKLISDLDRPRKNYRITYTITEKDGAKRLDTQHFTMVMVPSQRTVLKQGTKVPVVTGLYKAESGPETQVTYLDIGMLFDATLTETGNGVILRTKAEQTSVSEEKSGIGTQDPILRQTQLESTSSLILGKSTMLGSLDIPGTTRHLDVEATIELAQ